MRPFWIMRVSTAMVCDESGWLILKSFNRYNDHIIVKAMRMNSIAHVVLDINKTWEKSIDFATCIVFNLA